MDTRSENQQTIVIVKEGPALEPDAMPNIMQENNSVSQQYVSAVDNNQCSSQEGTSCNPSGSLILATSAEEGNLSHNESTDLKCGRLLGGVKDEGMSTAKLEHFEPVIKDKPADEVSDVTNKVDASMNTPDHHETKQDIPKSYYSVDITLESHEDQSQTGELSELPCILQTNTATCTNEEWCTVCGEVFQSDTAFKQHLRTHSGGHEYPCTMCDEGFATVGELRAHMIIHGNTNTDSSTFCDKTCTDTVNLAQHKKCHEVKKHLSCVQCNKVFSSSRELKNHLTTHTKDRPHACSVCGVHVKTKHSLVRHMRSHAANRTTYSCNLCDRTYAYVSSLKKHMLTHAGKQKYSCPKCNKIFLQKELLIAHASTPAIVKPYACTECEKTFTDYKSRNNHMVMHIREKTQMKTLSQGKTHSCTLCEEVFTSISNLNEHMRTHVVYPHVCSTCGKGFRLSASLRNHMRTHIDKIAETS